MTSRCSSPTLPMLLSLTNAFFFQVLAVSSGGGGQHLMRREPQNLQDPVAASSYAYYGDRVHKSSSFVAKDGYDERRIGDDGRPHTHAEYIDQYGTEGGERRWKRAPAAGVGASMVNLGSGAYRGAAMTEDVINQVANLGRVRGVMTSGVTEQMTRNIAAAVVDLSPAATQKVIKNAIALATKSNLGPNRDESQLSGGMMGKGKGRVAEAATEMKARSWDEAIEKAEASIREDVPLPSPTLPDAGEQPFVQGNTSTGKIRPAMMQVRDYTTDERDEKQLAPPKDTPQVARLLDGIDSVVSGRKAQTLVQAPMDMKHWSF